MNTDNKNKLLEVDDLSTYFFTENGIVKSVQKISFDVEKGKTFAIVGESGCGKSVTALSIMRLIPEPPGKIAGGKIMFNNKDLCSLTEKQMRKVRGNEIAMIFQEPMTSLNPVFTIGEQIVEAIKLHQKKTDSQAWELAVDVLEKVGIADPQQRVHEYPHQMSGGMRQRVMIAMAISCQPSLLIADEPTTALDVTIQAQIMDLLDELQYRLGMSILLITHDLGIVGQRSDNVAVMYASRIAEKCATKELFANTLHPYSQGLLRSRPKLGMNKDRLETIEGSVPEPLKFSDGCKFHPRCPLGRDDRRCQSVEPELREVAPGHLVACWKCPGYGD